jgi:hypothetical protein
LNKTYVIPKEDEQYLQNREDHAEGITKPLCNIENIRKNAKVVVGCNIIESDFKFINLVDEGYKCFLIGMYHSTVSLCSMTTERLCYDILESATIKFHDKELDYEQKKFLFNIPFIKIVQFLKNIGLINPRIETNMYEINNLRNKYVHPLLEGSSYEDAQKSINLLCKIIDSFISMQ